MGGQSGWNPPDGYYIWNLDYEMREEYWVLANNGTILFYSPPNLGPTSPPNQASISYGLIYGTAFLIVAVVLSAGVLIYFRKRKGIRTHDEGR